MPIVPPMQLHQSQQPMQQMHPWVLEKRFFESFAQTYGVLSVRFQVWLNNRRGTLSQFGSPLGIQIFLIYLNQKSSSRVRDPNAPPIVDNPLNNLYFLIQVVGITSSTMLVNFIAQ